MPQNGILQPRESSVVMKILTLIPMMGIILIGYFVAVALGVGEVTDGNPDPILRFFTEPLFSIGLPSGGDWSFTLEHMFIAIALLFLFFELVKSTSIGGTAIAEMALSTIVFIIYLVCFLVVPAAATSVFFILMMISFIDVLAGYIIGIKVARRDLAIGGGIM